MGHPKESLCERCCKKRPTYILPFYDVMKLKLCAQCAKDDALHFELLWEVPYYSENSEECSRIVNWYLDFVGGEFRIQVNEDVTIAILIDLMYFCINNLDTIFSTSTHECMEFVVDISKEIGKKHDNTEVLTLLEQLCDKMRVKGYTQYLNSNSDEEQYSNSDD